LGITVISWFSKKQTSVALSSPEAEYMVASLASCEAIWLHKLLTGLFGQELEPTLIHCDNWSCRLYNNIEVRFLVIFVFHILLVSTS
jgi:hypothetical protein